MDGQERQAHVDHLQPCPVPSDEPHHGEASPETCDTMLTLTGEDTAFRSFLFTDIDGTAPEQSQVSPQIVEPTQRPSRNCRPPQRLIEEMK